MRRFLLFRLHGPMASWATRAGNAKRPTDARPSRSAVFGLLGAALGVDRADTERLAELHGRLWFGGRVDRVGSKITDYHTVQSPKKPALRNQLTRSRELDLHSNELATSLTWRSYIQDGCWTIGLWGKDHDGDTSLDAIAAAMARPHWPLSLGRRSCPLACPLEPTFIESDSLARALSDVRFFSDSLIGEIPPNARLFFDAGAEAVGCSGEVIESRRDFITRGAARTFSVREEATGIWEPNPAQEQNK